MATNHVPLRRTPLAATLDANTIFVAPSSFAKMVQNTGSWVGFTAKKALLLVVSFVLFLRQDKGSVLSGRDAPLPTRHLRRRIRG
jgi:hypothetical protein